MRKTKIVCTIGPSCSDKKTLTEMAKAGMNIARLNFSHGTHEEHLKKINLIKEIRDELNLPIAILLDTKGPEYRIKTFKNGKEILKDGEEFTFTTREVEGTDKIVSVSYPMLHEEVKPGDRILVKNKVLKQVYLSEQDKADIEFGIKNDIDFIACSFVSCRQDLVDVKNFIGTSGDVGIIAKIENRSGIDNIEEICEECEGIMIGRGDMGVEIPFEDLPAIQKQLITKCRLLGKRVITATEMLEISDVANAVYDGTSAIMLSGETAAGKYPVLTVRTMARIAERTEESVHYARRFREADFQIKNTVDAISHATVGMAIDIGAKVIAACTLSGSTARMISRFRPPVDVLGITTNKKTWYKLALSWGVVPCLTDVYESTDVLFYTAKQKTEEMFNLKEGEHIVITGGTSGAVGNTNLIKIETV